MPELQSDVASIKISSNATYPEIKATISDVLVKIKRKLDPG